VAVERVSRVVGVLLILLCILKIISIFNLYVGDFTAVKEDTWRDYLVARHITHFGETAGAGPYTALLGSRFTSPVYYYFVALVVGFWDDVKSLFILNITLQTVSVFLAYLIAGKLFNKKTALLAIFLFIFSARGMEIISGYWHAWVNIPLILLSFYFLISGKKDRTIEFLITGIILAFASIAHISGFIFLVIYFVFIFLKQRKYLFPAIGSSLVVLLIFYLPLYFYFKSNGLDLGSVNLKVFDGISGIYRHSGVFYYLIPVFLTGFVLRKKGNYFIKIFYLILLITILNWGGRASQIFQFGFSRNSIESFAGKVIADNFRERGVSLLTYKNGIKNNLLQSRIYVEAEKISGKKLVKISDADIENYSVITPDTSVLYLICEQGDCIDDAQEFIENHGNPIPIYKSPFEIIYAFD
jgi:hypothetical protein